MTPAMTDTESTDLRSVLRTGLSRSLASLLIKVGTAGLTYVMYVIMSRLMGEAEYGYFAFGLSWIVQPFLVDIARHGWMAPFALILMAAGACALMGAEGARGLRRRAERLGEWIWALEMIDIKLAHERLPLWEAILQEGGGEVPRRLFALSRMMEENPRLSIREAWHRL